MSLSSLEALPREILLCISEYLDSPTKSQISPFARASKTCYSASIPCLYRTIRLCAVELPSRNGVASQQLMTNPQRLANHVASWRSRLERDAAYESVHCIKIWELDSSQLIDPRDYPKLVDGDDDFAGYPHRSLCTPLQLEYAEFSAEADERSPWSELARLIEKLPALRSLHFDCSRPLPSCLFRALHKANSHCKLHLDTFYFKGYLPPNNRNSEELSLLLSPRLAGLRTRSCGYCGYTTEDYTHEAIFALTGGLQPALEHVSMLTDLGFGPPMMMVHGIGAQNPRKPFPGFTTSSDIPPGRQAVLKSFEIGGSGPLSTELLKLWLEYCDVSRLRVLKLRIRTTHCGLDWLALKANFMALTTLVLGEDDASFEHLKIGDRDFSAAFINSLPPLVAIRFMCDVSEDAFQATMEQHGQSLKRLWFHPPVRHEAESLRSNPSHLFSNPFRVGDLRNCCRLEELVLTIPRSMGDATEVEIYRSLGRLPKLQNLVLTLDCEDVSSDLEGEGFADDTPIYPSFDEFDKEFAERDSGRMAGCWRRARNGHVRMGIINAALDENLARSIFATISRSKPTYKDVLLLERLELRPIGGKYTIETQKVAEDVGLWWLLERSERDDSRGVILATRLRYPGVLTQENGLPEDLYEAEEEIFHKIWPDTGRNWGEEWSSFPLAT